MYRGFLVQIAFVLVGGLVFLLLPLLLLRRSGLRDVRRLPVLLGFVSCLGYGYLAIETALIHDLIIFVGHPTYAVTVVIVSMLTASGLGSVFAGRVSHQKLTPLLVGALVCVIGLGLMQAFLVTGAFVTYATGLPVPLRLFLTAASLFPLGFVLGMPFPIALRLIPAAASPAVPWAWALNGWMSVVAGLVTVLISRNLGYSTALLVAVAAYTCDLALAPLLQTVGRTKDG